jgi:hypothetical protein
MMWKCPTNTIVSRVYFSYLEGIHLSKFSYFHIINSRSPKIMRRYWDSFPC